MNKSGVLLLLLLAAGAHGKKASSEEKSAKSKENCSKCEAVRRLKERITTMRQNIATQSTQFSDRISALETSLSSQITQLSNQVSTSETTLAAQLTAVADQLTTQISGVGNALMTETDAIDTLLGQMNTAMGDLGTSISAQTTTLMTAIGNLATGISTQMSQIGTEITNLGTSVDAQFGVFSTVMGNHATGLSTSLTTLQDTMDDDTQPPYDCSTVTSSGIESLSIAGNVRDAYCHVDGAGAWLVIQRREDGSENFLRVWAEYVSGFGDLNVEFWFGLDDIAFITQQKPHKLRIDLEDWEGNQRYAEYTTFVVAGSACKYKLFVDGYSGDAGDAMENQNGWPFTTIDVDNDGRSNENCAVTFTGAWWYRTCHASNLNGQYGNNEYGKGINWNQWTGFEYSLKSTMMRIMPI